MILSRQCACGQNVEFEAADLPQLNCPTCGRSLHEQFAPPIPDRMPSAKKIEASFEQPDVTTAPSRTETTLASVRSRSCYKTLRGLINGVVWIGLALVALFAIFELFAASQRSTGDIAPADLIAFVCCLVAAVLLVALRQALLLGIDAADVLIADRTDRLATRPMRDVPTGASVDK